MKKLGFGIMRLPMLDKEIDIEQTKKMVDTFLENGFNYFDTARIYLGSRCEWAIKQALTSRYPRESYILTDKLSPSCFEKEEDIRPLVDSQLNDCGVEYFDYYLMHSQHRGNYQKYKDCRAYEICAELREEGKIKHLGISFHDNAEFLDTILTEHPAIEVVQLQFNYVDYDSPSVQSRACYEVARKHGKQVLIMEPVKGGSLANIPDDAKAVFEKVGNGSPASYAIRFAAGFDGVLCVLSGMSNMEQMNDNISFMKDFEPLNEDEMKAVEEVKSILYNKYMIPCTGCKYCVDGCPMNIKIPRLFYQMNQLTAFCDKDAFAAYARITSESGKASECVECGACEESCPQHLEIRSLLKKVAETFEN